MPVSEIRSQLGNFQYDSEKTTDFTVVAAVIISDHSWRNEIVECHVLPTNDNAKAIFCALPWVCQTPPLVRQTIGCDFGIVASVHRGPDFSNPQKEVAANMKMVAVSALGDETDWETKRYRVTFHPKPLVIDERHPVRPELLTSMYK